jgi:putative ABC transport system permease protein
MRSVLVWLTDAALADSILGDLEEGRGRRGLLWFWSALSGIVGYAAWTRIAEFFARSPFRGSGGNVRHAVRVLRRRPGFTACTVILLALGIGANTAVFSVVRAVLLRPLPYADVDRLAFVWGGTHTNPGNKHSILTGQHAVEMQRGATTIESFALIKGWETGLAGQIDLILPDGAERLQGAQVTPNFFELLGARAAIGRAFSSADGDGPLAVISDSLWRRRFSADPLIIGRSAPFASGRTTRNGAPYTIVGVLPAQFRYSYPRETEVYLLFPWSNVRNGRALEYQMVARLKSGVSVSQAQTELTAIAKNVVRSYNNLQGPTLERVVAQTAILVEPMTDHLQAEVRPGLLLLVGVAALVLLIACVNLGLLLLARTVDRRGELGLRAALGAGTARIIRQLTAESAILSIAGGAVGVATAAIAMPVIRALMPPVVPRADQIAVDPLVLAFAVVLMVLTTLVCSIVPAWIVLRRDLLDEVRRSGGGWTSDRAVAASRRAIVTIQVAVVVLLLVGSGLLLQSFWRMQRVDLGFTAGEVLTMEMRLLNPKYRQPGRIAAFHEDLLTRVRAIPGVVRAGLTTAVPMRGVDFLMVVGPKDGKPKPGHARTVDPEYFQIMRLSLIGGRLFTPDDSSTGERVTVVSESYGRQHFGAANPVGRALVMNGSDVRIVGVVRDVRYADVTRNPAAAFYLPRVQYPPELICLLVEPQPGTRAQVTAEIRDAVRSIDPEQPVEGITTVRQIVSESTADRRFYAVTAGAFAGVALLLAIAGVFGAVSRTVTERKRELAIRVALGAAPARLRRLIYGYGLMPAGIGTVAGLAVAFGASRALQAFLFEIAATDLATYVTVAALVMAVTALACYLPARRSLRVQPMQLLKTD